MKNKIFILLLSLLLIVSITVSASVSLYDGYFYDPLTGLSCFFAATELSNDNEYGISLTDSEGNTSEYKSNYVTSDGRYGIALKDPSGILGSSYNIKAYSKNGDNARYSAKSLSVNTGIIPATPDTVAEIAANAVAGDVILLEPGTYEGINIEITSSGTEDKPIVIRSKSEGGAVFTGTSTIKISGSYVVISDMFFNGCVNDNCTVVSFTDCEQSRLTGCYFYQCGSKPTGIMIALGEKAVNCRIDNNIIEDSRAMSIQVNCGSLSTGETAALNNRIDHNLFLNIQEVGSVFKDEDNGFECIQTGTYQGSVEALGTIVEYNRFENVTGDNSEIISNKSNGNIFRYNTFLNCPSSPTIRKGNDCVFEGNYLINTSKGLRFYGSGHKILNNYMLNSGPVISDSGNNGSDGHRRQENIEVSGNIIVNPKSFAFMVGRQFDTMNLYTKLPKNVLVESNYLYLDNGKVVCNYTAFDSITYLDNTAVLKGGASLGDTDTGFKCENNELIESDGLLIPDGVTVERKGYIKLADINNRWISSIENDALENILEPDETPVSYTNAYTKDYILCNGDSFNIRNLAGTASYENGKSYEVNPEDVEFAFSNNKYFNISGDVITLKNTDSAMHSFYITSTYKGLTAQTKVYVYPEALKNSDSGDLFDENGSFHTFADYGTRSKWISSDGTLEVTEDKSSAVLLTGYTHKSGNFDFQCDITISQYEENIPFAAFVFGYSNFGNKEISRLVLTEGGGLYSSSYEARTGELKEAIKIGKKQRLRVVKNNDTIIASLDGNIISMAKINPDLFGKFGFEAKNATLTVENINIFKNEYADSSVNALEMSYERIDEEIINISFNAPFDDCIYRIYKNGEYAGLLNPDECFVDIESFIDETNLYTLEAYDLNGVKKAEGMLTVQLSEPGDNEFFMISDVLSRNGTNGEYTGYYTSENRFLDVGSFPYCDRSYRYIQVDESFADCGYISTGNGDRNNTVFESEADDWLTFNINRSATVYVIVHKQIKIPVWLTDWECAEDSCFAIDNNIGTAYIYSKHFSTADGDKLNIRLGGIKSLSSMYQVVIKPDVMPEKVEISRHF